VLLSNAGRLQADRGKESEKELWRVNNSPVTLLDLENGMCQERIFIKTGTGVFSYAAKGVPKDAPKTIEEPAELFVGNGK